MDDLTLSRIPAQVRDIERETKELGFTMASDTRTGALLRTLAATKPGGAFLELGTGTGLGTAWILAGMDQSSHLLTVDNDEQVVSIARKYLGSDSRAVFNIADGAQFLESISDRRFDFIFADTWAGKYDHLESALRLLSPGAFYIIDDMSPVDSWPEGHARKVDALDSVLESR
ncbi:MAG TPA: class I SAM-dependent methyltransferase, partial [Blastocatellia bacterium]|nr:class I SAM-dependent methyltransferase [Blastocatellia bacterium]